MINIIESIIRYEFEKNVGRWQSKQEKRFGMKISFQINLDYEKESGYRFLELFIYSDYNYVAVLQRERYTVIDQKYLEYTEDGDCFVKKGHDYNEGYTDWKVLSYHDSCWSDAIETVIKEYKARILLIDSRNFKDWYTKEEPTKDILDAIAKY
jgi:hypothetical protein